MVVVKLHSRSQNAKTTSQTTGQTKSPLPLSELTNVDISKTNATYQTSAQYLQNGWKWIRTRTHQSVVIEAILTMKNPLVNLGQTWESAHQNGNSLKTSNNSLKNVQNLSNPKLTDPNQKCQLTTPRFKKIATKTKLSTSLAASTEQKTPKY